MLRIILFPFLIVLATGFGCTHGTPTPPPPPPPPRIKTGKETWGYLTVREGANMFFWLYYTTADVDYKTRPLIVWLQGGPGASSTGIGNFLEIGPQDEGLNNRTNTWTKEANVLFIDNPVGTGFSYVNHTSQLAQNNTAIANDLVSFMKGFLKKIPEFEAIPLYIFAESYGGKMAVQFAQALRKAVEAKKLTCQLAGVALGDSWVSPVDAVQSWGPYLYSMSLVDSIGLSQISTKAKAVADAVNAGKLGNATMLWSETEKLIEDLTNGVNFYNILDHPKPDNSSSNHNKSSMQSSGIEHHPNHIFGPVAKSSHDQGVKKSPHKFSSPRIEDEDVHHLSESEVLERLALWRKMTDKQKSGQFEDLRKDFFMTGTKSKHENDSSRKHHQKFKHKLQSSRREKNRHLRKHEKDRHHGRLTKMPLSKHLQYLYNRHVGDITAALDKFMNGPVKEKLKMIPQNVTWGGQSASVFDALSTDFMVPVVQTVESLLNNTSMKVVVYNGQLDLIVDTPGVEKWVENLKWAGTSGWLSAKRKPIELKSGATGAFSKSFKNFTFYWIMEAGHMIPADGSEIALWMMKDIVGIKNK